MLPSKSCKTINANFLLKNFGLTFFDRFKTRTYLVNWFGRGSADWTWRFGGSAEPCRTSKFGRYRCRFISRSLLDSKNYHSLFWLKLELHAEPSCLQHFRDRNELRNGEGWVHLVFLLLGWHPCLIAGLPYWLFPIWLPHAMEWCYAEIYKNCRFIGCPN